MQDQDNQIITLTDRVESMMEGDSCHAPGKLPMMQDKGDLQANNDS